MTAPESWDWVPAFVAQPPSKISHGLCPLCTVYYYGPGVLCDAPQPEP